MSLIHALVARGAVVLAEHSTEQGKDWSHATQTILSKIPPNNSKLTYAADNYLFHYVKQDEIVCLVMAEDSVGRKMPFTFLSDLQRRFTSTYSRDEITDAPAYGMNSFSTTIAQLMDQYVNNPPTDPFKQAQAELADVKNIMVHNVESILSRGERIELLVDKTDNLNNQARAFRMRSTQLRRKMWWKNTKLMTLSIFVVLLIVYLLAASACGVSLGHCRS